jgi:hypothetical protein
MYTKCRNIHIPNNNKTIIKIFHSKTLHVVSKFGIFGMQIYHLATLLLTSTIKCNNFNNWKNVFWKTNLKPILIDDTGINQWYCFPMCCYNKQSTLYVCMYIMSPLVAWSSGIVSTYHDRGFLYYLRNQ